MTGACAVQQLGPPKGLPRTGGGAGALLRARERVLIQRAWPTIKGILIGAERLLGAGEPVRLIR